jgi:hypothetical protein
MCGFLPPIEGVSRHESPLHMALGAECSLLLISGPSKSNVPDRRISMTTFSLTDRDQELFQAFEHLVSSQFPDLQERFGLWRVHHHFDVSANEVFYETSNDQSRTSTLQIVPVSELPAKAIPSCWSLKNGSLQVASWCCDGPVDIPSAPPVPVGF